VQGGAELSEDTIAESGISLLLAGTDTSGGGSTAALAMLAQFPHVMQRLREEQQQVSTERIHGSNIGNHCHTFCCLSTAALAMLAQFPHVIQRLREEQQQVSAELMYVLSIIDMDCHTCGLMKTPSTTLVCMALPTP
jgi:cytochrome P450